MNGAEDRFALAGVNVGLFELARAALDLGEGDQRVAAQRVLGRESIAASPQDVLGPFVGLLELGLGFGEARVGLAELEPADQRLAAVAAVILALDRAHVLERRPGPG